MLVAIPSVGKVFLCEWLTDCNVAPSEGALHTSLHLRCDHWGWAGPVRGHLFSSNGKHRAINCLLSQSELSLHTLMVALAGAGSMGNAVRSNAPVERGEVMCGQLQAIRSQFNQTPSHRCFIRPVLHPRSPGALAHTWVQLEWEPYD